MRMRLSAWKVALFFLAVQGCSSDPDTTPLPSGSGGDGGGGMAGQGGAGAAGGTGGAGGMAGMGGTGGAGGGITEFVWPNPIAPTNSHAWMRENHAELIRMEPRVLVLDVVQRSGLVPVEQTVNGLVAAFAEMSRYHGYSDPQAKPFLQYQVDKIIDMKDPGGAEYPSFWPPAQPSGWDVGQLFTPEFAPRLGYADPDNPGQYLTMCQLFERGIIHELWIAADAGVRNVYENQSHLQVYDDQLEPVAGVFDDCTNGCFYDPLAKVNCSVTARIQEINKGRGPGCGTHAAGHAQEHLTQTIPYLRDNARRFWNFDLNQRHGLTQNSLYACPYVADLCVDFPTPERMVSSTTWPGAAFDVSSWGAGCGNIHFPPNGRTQYDYYSAVPALSSCEGYGLGGGPGGGDALTTYTSKLTEQYEMAHGDCGGGWIVYMSQSMPGFGNQSKDVKGAPMLNWWPFLFY